MGQLDFGLLPVADADRFRAPDPNRFAASRSRLQFAIERIAEYWGSEVLASKLGKTPGAVRSAVSGVRGHHFRFRSDMPVLLGLDVDGYLAGAVQSCVQPQGGDGAMVIALSRAALKLHGRNGHEALMRETNHELCRMRGGGQ